MKKTIEELALEYIQSIAGTDPNTDISLFENEYNAFMAGANAVKNNVDLAEVGKCYYGVYDENGDLLHVHHSQTGADKYCKALEKMRGYPFYMDEVTVWP